MADPDIIVGLLYLVGGFLIGYFLIAPLFK